MTTRTPALSNDPIISLHPADNVGVARVGLLPGETIADGIDVRDEVPSGHKIALRRIAEGAEVLKYGFPIGRATRAIAAGEHVHTHNVAMVEHKTVEADGSGIAPVVPMATRSFLGYDRGDGRIGTRNFVGIICTVNCSATVARAIADKINHSAHTKSPWFDGAVALSHGGGCAIALDSEGYGVLARTLGGYARHPNFLGILVIGLGCETNQIDHVLKVNALDGGPLLRAMTIQDAGGTVKAVAEGIAHIEAMLAEAPPAPRTPQPLSGLRLALECGGSDGYSGISANPALGVAADMLVAEGGTACLSETPEIYGAEHLLLQRARSREVADRLNARIDWWRDHTARNGMLLDNNPSHGNKAGGLTTILEKSLGAVAKGGSSPLMAVYEYAEPIREHGLVFMDTPGYDPVAVTGQVAGGCNIICFTTGRGSVSGFKPAPCIKLATNTPLYDHMSDDMDIDCGTIVTGTESVEEVGRRIFDLILSIASGEETRSEHHGFGDNEFVPWSLGAVT